MTNNARFLFMLALLAATVVWAGPQRALAAGVVGNGTASSCHEGTLNAAIAGGGLVTFNCGGPATIIVTVTKQILIDTAIDGGGLITLRMVNPGSPDRLFFSNDGVRFTLKNIILRDGESPGGGGAIEASGAYVTLDNVTVADNTAVGSGGAIYCFGGTDGTLTITNSTISGNTAARGGGIYNDGCLTTITNSQIVRNEGVDGGGLYVATDAHTTLNAVTLSDNYGGYGGGIENSGILTVTWSLITDNAVTGSGGGVWNIDGRALIRQTTISRNWAYEGGGINSYGDHVELQQVNIAGNITTDGPGGAGIYHNAGTFFVSDSTISGNAAFSPAANGGGIYQNSDDNLTLTNVTLSDNYAENFGGGFYHRARYAILTNTTIAGNTAADGSAIYEDSPGTPENPGIIQIRNSLIYGNINNCAGALFETLGHNISQGTCPSLSHGTDQANIADIKMAAPAFNGGPIAMKTVVPRPDSPAVDAGDPAACPLSDQRGLGRVGGCDAGAAEQGALARLALIPLIVAR